MKNIASRLDKLEATLNQGKKDVLTVLPRRGESQKQAIAKARQEAGTHGEERLLLISNVPRPDQSDTAEDDLDQQIETEIEALKDEGWTERQIEKALSAANVANES